MIEEDERGASAGLPGNALALSTRWMAIAKAELGLFEEAESLAGKVLVLTQSMQPFEYIYSQSTLGFVLLIKGDFEAAIVPSRLAIDAVEKTDTPFMIPVTASQLGWLLAKQGHYAEALELGHQAVRAAEDIGISAGKSRWNARLAEVCFCAQKKEEALNYADAAARIADAASEPVYLSSALRLRGRIIAKSTATLSAAAPISRGL